MTKLMEDIEGAEVIVDDILVSGATIQEDDERLRKVLDRGRQCNLKLSKSKCKFRKDEVEYVGHIISKHGLKPDPEKVRAVKMIPNRTLRKRYLPYGVLKHVSLLLSSSNLKCQNPQVASTLLSTLTFGIFATTSSTVFMG
jgi:hypothetical protein